MDSPARKALLTQSIASFRAALEIHTQSVFPIQWARAQTNLARSCALVPDERCAADSFASVLRLSRLGRGYGGVRALPRLFLVAGRTLSTRHGWTTTPTIWRCGATTSNPT